MPVDVNYRLCESEPAPLDDHYDVGVAFARLCRYMYVCVDLTMRQMTSEPLARPPPGLLERLRTGCTLGRCVGRSMTRQHPSTNQAGVDMRRVMARGLGPGMPRHP